MSKFRNTVLRHLEEDVLARLALRPVSLELLHEIEFPGSPIDNLFFIEEGAASMTATFNDGSQVEVTLFGVESVIGISAMMGTRRSLNRVYTQIAGHGYTCSIQAGQREFARCGSFQTLSLRFVQAQLVQSMQSIGCNVRHSVEQRLARWLLICADRTQTQRLALSQEFLSQMLGNTRPTVSLTAAILRDEGLIDYTRGWVSILDRDALERRACECYHITKRYLDDPNEFDKGHVG